MSLGRPDSGLGFQVKVLKTLKPLKLFPFHLEAVLHGTVPQMDTGVGSGGNGKRER